MACVSTSKILYGNNLIYVSVRVLSFVETRYMKIMSSERLKRFGRGNFMRLLSARDIRVLVCMQWGVDCGLYIAQRLPRLWFHWTSCTPLLYLGQSLYSSWCLDSCSLCRYSSASSTLIPIQALAPVIAMRMILPWSNARVMGLGSASAPVMELEFGRPPHLLVHGPTSAMLCPAVLPLIWLVTPTYGYIISFTRSEKMSC